MSVSRLASASIVSGCLVLVGVTASAQFGNVLKRAPKPPSVPTATKPSAPASPAPGPSLYCAGITDENINRYLKAKEVQKQVLQRELAEANARKAEADALNRKADALGQKRAEQMLSTMMATEECKDKFKEKDPRSKRIARLEDLMAAANDRGDEAKAEAIQNELSPLSNALDVEADRACGGKGTSALHDCLEKKKAALAKQGLTEPMLTVQAQGECMQDPSTSGFAGATAASAEEEAATEGAAELLRNAESNADKAGADAAGLSGHEFNKLDHCIRNVIGGNPATPTTPESTAAINRRAAELKAALR